MSESEIQDKELATLRAFAAAAKRAQDELAQLLGQRHDYLSTACHHREHQDCRLTCKFCAATCYCTCHRVTL